MAEHPSRPIQLAVGGTMLSLVLSLGGLLAAATADATQPMSATTWVNMRSGPSTSKGVVTILSPREAVTATGKTSGRWYEVTTTGDLRGWVYGSYLVSATASSQAAATAVRATANVNVRTGPSTSTAKVGVASRGLVLATTGATKGDWVQVTFQGSSRWIHGDYLKATSAAPTSTAAMTDPIKTTGKLRTTASVNVRTGPSTSYAKVGVAAKGTQLGTTGSTKGNWTQVVFKNKARWIHSSYLTSATSTTTPKATGQVRTTANLYLRTGGSISDRSTGVLPGNSVVDTTGRTTKDYTQVIVNGTTRWIATRYTKPVAVTVASTSTPKAAGTVYVTVGTLNVRATSASNGKVVGTVSRGTALKITGKKTSTRTQIIHKGVARWVYSAYVSAKKPSTATPLSTTGKTLIGIDRLNANAKKVVSKVLESYPKITNIYGWRASSSYSSDHPNGRAVDVMIPNYKASSMADYGWTIAKHFQKNASTYGVKYIIFRQKIWNAAYPDRGWRSMENRGSDTANHYDHVHISVKD
ncbi:MAG: SH3 domain-containing protein [Propioniciclava sp.]